MQGEPDIRFTVDHMLIGLGKYLRILGYDAAWDPALRTQELILTANREDRIFLTRNRHLLTQHPYARHKLILTFDDGVKQLHQVIHALNLDTSTYLFSRCIRCNVRLRVVTDRERVRSAVHPNVVDQYEEFYECPRCGTIFWKGSHVRNTCRKLGLEWTE